MKIAIIGQGYVGRSIAEASAGAGHSVIGFDTDSSVISTIKINGDYRATTDASLIGSAEVVVIAVPTPLNRVGEPDLALLMSAIESIAPFLGEDTLVINESTSYIGTLRNVIKPILDKYFTLSIFSISDFC